MVASKLSISMDSEILEEAREAAALEGMALSAWLAEAARERARLTIARAALDEHIAEFGEPDPETEMRVREKLLAAGFYDPETPEHAKQRARALARLDGLSEEI